MGIGHRGLQGLVLACLGWRFGRLRLLIGTCANNVPQRQSLCREKRKGLISNANTDTPTRYMHKLNIQYTMTHCHAVQNIKSQYIYCYLFSFDTHMQSHFPTLAVLTSVRAFPLTSRTRVVSLPSNFCTCTILPPSRVMRDCREKRVLHNHHMDKENK